MQLTEKERLLVVEKKEEIRKLSEEIIDLSTDFVKNEKELKKRTTAILSLLSTIASFTSKKIEMRPFIALVTQIFYSAEKGLTPVASIEIELFCNVINSMIFDFTKRDFKVNISKIDLSLIKT
jgi:hypothetical protein